jgi:hypothetical protein
LNLTVTLLTGKCLKSYGIQHKFNLLYQRLAILSIICHILCLLNCPQNAKITICGRIYFVS